MWNRPSEEVLDKIPGLYETEDVPTSEKLVYLHFFMMGADWYVTEYDGKDTCFGFVNLGDPVNAEWGCFSLSELASVNIGGIEVDRDLHWVVRKASEVDGIKVWG